MNPWSFYQHKPQLFEACVVAACAIAVLPKLEKNASRAAAWAGLAWAFVGVIDYATYAFGYTLAGLGARGVVSVQTLFEWLRVPILAIAAWATHAAVSTTVSARCRD